MKKEEETKVPLLLFSGGLDSSYMLQMYLERGNVETLYVKGLIHEDKIAKELDARKKIIAALQEKTGNYVLRDHIIDIGPIFGGGTADIGFAQPPMWIVGALQVSDYNKHSELAIGYVAGDQIACMIPYIINAWDNLQYFAKHGNIPVVFPLKVTRKVDILEAILPQIVQHIWVCEMPEWWRDGKMIYIPDGLGGKLKPCGKCPACITMVGTLHMYKQKHDVPYSHHFLWKLRDQQRERGHELTYATEGERNEDQTIHPSSSGVLYASSSGVLYAPTYSIRDEGR